MYQAKDIAELKVYEKNANTSWTNPENWNTLELTIPPSFDYDFDMFYF